MTSNRRSTLWRIATTAAFSIGLALATDASAQEITGVPGSPSATMTIDGKQ